MNKYEDYLPKNRNNNSDSLIISPKLLKKGLVVFWTLTFAVVGILFLRVNGVDVLEVDDRNYNMNLKETIDLDKMYDLGDSVEWISNGKNVEIRNNVVVAKNSGNAYIYAKKDGKQLKDLSINVLNGNEVLRFFKHSLTMSLGASKKLNINYNKNGIGNSKKSLMSKIKDLFSGVKLDANDSLDNGTENSNDDSDTNITYETC